MFLKVEVPVSMQHVEGTRTFVGGDAAYTVAEAVEHFKEQGNVTDLPFIYLSASVSISEFTESLELAAKSGTGFNGVLCGRAIWKEGIPVYASNGLEVFRSWLGHTGVTYV